METEHRNKKSERSTGSGGMSSHDSPAETSRGLPHQEERISSSSSRISLVRWKKLCNFVYYSDANTSRVLPHPPRNSIALLHAPPSPKMLLYGVSCLLDALDGAAARYFEQTPQFGAVMDMVTDRYIISCPVVFPASAFLRWSFAFQDWISLDFASHYIQDYATVPIGGSSISQKEVGAGRPWATRLYYSNTRWVELLESDGSS